MSYTFGKPRPDLPYTDAGDIAETDVVVSLLTRVKVVARVPAEHAQIGGDLPSDFEPHLRKAIAERLVDMESGGFTVVYVAVEQFEDARG